MSVPEPAAPVAPTDTARVAHRPLAVANVRLTGGPFARWQQVNRELSLPMAAERLEAAGNLNNVRLVTGEVEGGASEYKGPRFMDSDLYKTLEAIGWDAAQGADDRLDDFVRTTTEVLERAQGDDGYLNSHYQVVQPQQRYAWLEHSHEMYCAGHLMQAAVALSRCTNDKRLLGIATRFADHLVEVFLHGGNDGIDGHPEVETALVELYRRTGTASYLELARKLVDNRGQGLVGNSGIGHRYFQDHLPVREAETLVGHAVRALYLDAGVVDLYTETGDESLLESSIRRWEDMVATKTALTGGLGSRHAREAFGDAYELPPDRCYNETCAAIASVHWTWRLLLVTGESRYADLIERTLFNAFASSTSADGNKFFYVNPLQRRADHFEGDDTGRRHEWFTCACCPPNIMRLVASLGHYVATTAEDVLHIHQYLPGVVQASLPDGELQLSVEGDYPWDGEIRLTVDRAPGSACGLGLRLPAWSRTASLHLGDEEVPATADERGYVVVRREWQPGDTLRLRLDMTPRLVYPHQRIDALRGTVAVERGPLVYCFEQIDQQGGADIEELALEPDAELRVLPPVDLEGVGRTVRIEADAVAVSQPVDGLPYASEPPAESTSTRPVEATAMPYFQWDNRDGGPMRVWLPVAERQAR